MEFLFDILDDLLELIWPLIKRFFGFITKRLIPYISLSIADIKEKKRLKKFNDELDLKK